MNISWTFIGYALAFLGGWTGFLLGMIRYLLGKQIAGFETRLVDADTRAGNALTAVAEHREAVATIITAIRVDMEKRQPCSNHPRMENDNSEQFTRIARLDGKIEKMDGKIDQIIRNLDLLMQHHIQTGGK